MGGDVIVIRYIFLIVVFVWKSCNFLYLYPEIEANLPDILCFLRFGYFFNSSPDLMGLKPSGALAQLEPLKAL